jgi:DNA-binding NarL/FixJ family response regulator
VNSIIEKLEVSDRTEAATTAIHRGIIELNG